MKSWCLVRSGDSSRLTLHFGRISVARATIGYSVQTSGKTCKFCFKYSRCRTRKWILKVPLGFKGQHTFRSNWVSHLLFTTTHPTRQENPTPFRYHHNRRRQLSSSSSSYCPRIIGRAFSSEIGVSHGDSGTSNDQLGTTTNDGERELGEGGLPVLMHA